MAVMNAYKDINEGSDKVWAIESSVRDLQADGDTATGDVDVDGEDL